MITDIFNFISDTLASIKLSPGLLVMGIIPTIGLEPTKEEIEENIIGVADGCELTIELEDPHPFEELMKELMEKLPDDTNYLDLEIIKWDRKYWHSVAAFARSRMAARAQAFARQMEHQKARQAMKRRKLMHADGHFPDCILLGGKVA